MRADSTGDPGSTCFDSATETDPTACFDHHDTSRSAGDIRAVFEQLRSTCPVAHVDRYGGFELVSGYAEIRQVIASRDDFSSAGEGVFIPRPPGLPPQLPAMEFDGDQHRAWRKVFDGLLSPAAVRPLEPVILEIIDRHIDAFAERGSVDLVPAYTHPVPGVVIGRIVGLSVEESLHNQQLFDTFFSSPAEDSEANFGAFVEFILERLHRRRRAPQQDFLSELASGNYQGMETDDNTAILILVALLGGGHHSTASGLAGLVNHVLSNDELRRRLVADPKLVTNVVNESLRLTTPLPLFARTATADSTIGDCPVAEGSRVFLNYSAANRDPDEFDHPNEFVVDRPHNRHLAFGYGAHICSGQHLARLELRLGLLRLLERLPDLALDGDVAFSGLVGGNLMGISRMPVRFTPVR
jgi:cytochrome P450